MSVDELDQSLANFFQAWAQAAQAVHTSASAPPPPNPTSDISSTSSNLNIARQALTPIALYFKNKMNHALTLFNRISNQLANIKFHNRKASMSYVFDMTLWISLLLLLLKRLNPTFWLTPGLISMRLIAHSPEVPHMRFSGKKDRMGRGTI